MVDQDYGELDAQQAKSLFSDFLRRPVNGAQLLRFREMIDSQLVAVWDALDAQEVRLDNLEPVRTDEGIVQQTINAMERNLGDQVKVVGEIQLTREDALTQLSEESVNLLLKREDDTMSPAVSLTGCLGIVVARDPKAHKVLVRLLFTPSLLMIFDEDHVKVVEGGRALGTFSPQELSDV